MKGECEVEMRTIIGPSWLEVKEATVFLMFWMRAQITINSVVIAHKQNIV